jgi:hypothetical protein
MRRILQVSCSALLAVTLTSFAFSQRSAGVSYPKILLIVSDPMTECEGRSGLEKVLRKLKSERSPQSRWIATEVVAGNMRKAVALFPLSKFAEASDVLERIETAVRTLPQDQQPNLHSTMYQLDTDASFDGSEIPWNQATAFAVNYVTLRRGTPDVYRDQQVLAARLLSRAKVNDEVWIGYALRFGEQSPGYLFVSPLRSLEDLDVDMSGRGSLFTPEQDKTRAEALRLSVISDRQKILRVQKELSSLE